MSQIEYVKLTGNMTFRSSQGGGFDEQRTMFAASEHIDLSERRGIGVDVRWGGRHFTIPWAQIQHVEWGAERVADVKKPAA